MAKQISKEITSELQFSQSQRMDTALPAAPAGALCPGSEPEGPGLFKSLGHFKGQKTA